MKSKYLICAGIILVFSGFYSSYGQKIYLSPDGNEGNPGTIDKPLATLTAACDRAREYPRNGNKTYTVRIVPLTGEYFMLQPLSLSAEDSGTPDLATQFDDMIQKQESSR